MTPEKLAEDDVLLGASSINCRLLRNNSGAIKHDGRMIRFGLGNTSSKINKVNKSSDYIGITKVVITPEMVGKTIGVFTAIEVKKRGFIVKAEYPKGSREHAQNNFLNFVRDFGGFSGFTTSVEDLHSVINHYLNWLKK